MNGELLTLCLTVINYKHKIKRTTLLLRWKAFCEREKGRRLRRVKEKGERRLRARERVGERERERKRERVGGREIKRDQRKHY